MPGQFKRSGLHKLKCPAATCDGYVYATVAQLEAHGLPSCPCGAMYVPAEVELAELLGLEDCAAIREYEAEVSSIMRGQDGKAGHGRALGQAPADRVYTPLGCKGTSWPCPVSSSAGATMPVSVASLRFCPHPN
jgi:hypothetical protein